MSTRLEATPCQNCTNVNCHGRSEPEVDPSEYTLWHSQGFEGRRSRVFYVHPNQELQRIEAVSPEVSAEEIVLAVKNCRGPVDGKHWWNPKKCGAIVLAEELHGPEKLPIPA